MSPPAFCAKCGASLYEGALFCGSCGEALMLPHMDAPDNSIGNFLSYLLFSHRGRIGRLWFLIGGLIHWAVLIPVILLGILNEVFWLLMVPWVVFAVWSGIMLMSKRLHDIGQSGFFVLLYFVPVVGGLLPLFLLFWPGNKGINKYGHPPGAK